MQTSQMIFFFLQIHLLHCIEQKERGIGLYVNSNKSSFMSFNQDSATSSLNGKLLKLVGQFKYLSSHISSTKIDINIRISNARTAIDKAVHTFPKGISPKREHNSAAGIRTRLLRIHSPAHEVLPYENSLEKF